MVKKIISVKEIVSSLREDIIEVKGTYFNKFIDNVSDSQHTTSSTLDWVNITKKDKQQITENTLAKIIIVDPSVKYSDSLKAEDKVLIYVSNPRKMVAKVIDLFFLEKAESFIHPSAVIHKEAIISETANIEAGCVIGKATIGNGTIVKPNVVIYDDVIIGDKCIIQAGVIIGTDGLGCMRESDGKLFKFPHMGGVIIGNNVEIGANSQIAKGVLSDTIIRDGCKINGLCFIAHNCVLDENVWITGNSMLCGTAHIGENATIYSNVIIRDQTIIGKNTVIGMGSVVTKNVPDGEVWFGSPAQKKK